MSWYEITRACGHVEEIDIRGTNVHGERERQAKYLATLDCRDCYRQAKAAETRDLADSWADLAALPALVGSEKQIAWAEKIRVDGIAAIVRDVTEPPTGVNKLARAVHTGHLAVAFGPALELLDSEDRATVAHLLIGVASRHRQARWWIDSRDHITGSTIDAMSEDEHTKLALLLGHPR